MTTQSGFILSHLDVYSVAKCIITVKFLISKFARFNSMTTNRMVHVAYAMNARLPLVYCVLAQWN